MEEIKVQNASQEKEPVVEGFSIHDARELKNLLVRFMKEYGKKPAEQSDEEWLKLRFLSEMPEMSEEEAAQLSSETVASIREYDENLASLKKAREEGRTSEEWFAEKAQEAASGLSVLNAGVELSDLDAAVDAANQEMFYVCTTGDYRTSRAWNLDGFIAEQHHVNTFNLAATASHSPYRAEVCTPEPGHTYGKNSFDVVIKNKNGQIVHQYQFKYGKDAETTIAMIRRGNYNNQTLVVPPEQVEAVQAAFPGKTVVSQIGGTEKVPIHSQQLSKADAKNLQKDVQQDRQFPELDWSAYDNKVLAKNIGRMSASAGIMGAALGAGFHIASKLAADEPIESEEVVATALETGADAGIKTATTGAIKVASERGILKIVPKGTKIGTIANVVCVAIENVKILLRVARGEITMGEALDLMGCNTVAMTFGLRWGAFGAGIGVLALSWIPVAGPVIGGFAGGLIGYMAGSKVGETVYNTAKKVAEVAKETAKKLWEKGKEAVSNLASKIKEFLFS